MALKLSVTFVTVSALACLGQAVQVHASENSGPTVGGRLQIWGVGQRVKDSERSDNRLYLFVKQARLRVDGEKNSIGYNLQLGFAGSESVVISKTGVSLNLLDISANIPLGGNTYLKVGQFKVPYSREQLADSGYLLFSERSISRVAFDPRRDTGLALHTYQGNFAGTVGVFTGGGRDVPERYLPEKLGVPLLVGRFGYNTLDKDIFTVMPNERQDGMSFFVNGLYTKDSLIGHSTVLNVELDNKGLMTNANWNPYIAKKPLKVGILTQYGADFAYRSGEVSVGAEYNMGKFSNSYGQIKLSSLMVQSAYSLANCDLGVQYSNFIPDSNFTYNYVDSKNVAKSAAIFEKTSPVHEVVPGLTYFFADRAARVVLDAPYLIGVPVTREPGIGTYVLTDHPDQVSILALAGGTVERQNVWQARLMLQMSF
jgi:hypothetical protein